MAGSVIFQSGTLATPPVNSTIAADTVVINGGTVLAQRVKLGFGADGTYTEVQAGSAFPITGTVGISGTPQVIVGQPATWQSVSTLYGTNVTKSTIIAAPSSGTAVYIYDMFVSAATAGSVLLEYGLGTRVLGPVFLAANGGFSYSSPRGLKVTSGSQVLFTNFILGSVSVMINYGTAV